MHPMYSYAVNILDIPALTYMFIATSRGKDVHLVARVDQSLSHLVRSCAAIHLRRIEILVQIKYFHE